MRVNGAVLRSRYHFIKGYGADALAKVMDALRPDTRAAVETGFLETRWYPYELLVELTEVADRILGEGDLALCYEMGRFSCDATLTTAHRLLFKFGDINWIIGRASKAWHAQYDEGEMKVVTREDDLVVIELHDVPHPNRGHCLAIKGWMIRAAELSGEEGFECEELCRAAGDPVCRWSFRWIR